MKFFSTSVIFTLGFSITWMIWNWCRDFLGQIIIFEVHSLRNSGVTFNANIFGTRDVLNFFPLLLVVFSKILRFRFVNFELATAPLLVLTMSDWQFRIHRGYLISTSLICSSGNTIFRCTLLSNWSQYLLGFKISSLFSTNRSALGLLSFLLILSIFSCLLPCGGSRSYNYFSFPDSAQLWLLTIETFFELASIKLILGFRFRVKHFNLTCEMSFFGTSISLVDFRLVV